MTRYICDLDKWFIIDDQDDLYEIIKERHEASHIPHDTKSERDGKLISQNKINGVVTWSELD